jgi:hypothetical protein
MTRFASAFDVGGDFLETAMHESQASIHYAPASVGTLIDTGLLRRVIRDAEGGKPDNELVPASRRPWRIALRALVELCLRHRKPG